MSEATGCPILDGHKWIPTPRGHGETIQGDPRAYVALTPTSRGYVWSYDKRYGHAATLDEARQWVEAIRETMSIPRGQRWLDI